MMLTETGHNNVSQWRHCSELHEHDQSIHGAVFCGTTSNRHTSAAPIIYQSVKGSLQDNVHIRTLAVLRQRDQCMLKSMYSAAAVIVWTAFE